MNTGDKNRLPVPWLAMVAAAAIGFLVARYVERAVPARGVGATVAEADSTQAPAGTPSARGAVDRAVPLAPVPDEALPLVRAFDALAARARRGDLDANARLLRGLVRCRTYGEGDYQPYHESHPDEHPTDAQIGAWRAFFDSAQTFCADLSQEQKQSEVEWLERAAESGDAEAMFCFAVEPPLSLLPTLSPAWLAARQRYIARALDYAERAFEQGYAPAAWALYATYADAEPATPSRSYLIPPGARDPARAYAFARFQADRLRIVAALRNGIAAEWSDRADLLAVALSAGDRARGEAFAREHAARTAPSPRGFCSNSRVLP